MSCLVPTWEIPPKGHRDNHENCRCTARPHQLKSHFKIPPVLVFSDPRAGLGLMTTTHQPISQCRFQLSSVKVKGKLTNGYLNGMVFGGPNSATGAQAE